MNLKKKSRLVKSVEQEKLGGEPLETALPRMVNELGRQKTAQRLDVSDSTIDYWMLRMGYRPQRTYTKSPPE